jgi:glycosyltransferase involved in cell wall biosynthesis
LGIENRVRWLGAVPERLLPALFSGATLFVFPSLYEGFGLPVLEAMACGTPVACSATPALAELVDQAGSLFDPLDVSAMAETLQELLADEGRRQGLADRGLERAAAFSWERVARATLAVYQEIAL